MKQFLLLLILSCSPFALFSQSIVGTWKAIAYNTGNAKSVLKVCREVNKLNVRGTLVRSSEPKPGMLPDSFVTVLESNHASACDALGACLGN